MAFGWSEEEDREFSGSRWLGAGNGMGVKGRRLIANATATATTTKTASMTATVTISVNRSFLFFAQATRNQREFERSKEGNKVKCNSIGMIQYSVYLFPLLG